MKRKKKRNKQVSYLIILVFLGTFPCISGAGEAAPPWKAEAEAGYIMTTGNTETGSVTARIDITREWTGIRQHFHADGVYASEKDDTGEDVTTAQKFFLSSRTNYKFDARNSAFALLTYDDDRFSGYKYQASATLGYERVLIKTPDLYASAEIGPGYRYSRLEEKNDDNENYTDEAIVRMGAKLVWSLSKHAQFTQDLSIEAGEDATITRSVSAIKTNINSYLAMKLSYSLKYTSSVPEDTEKTDTQTAMTLVVSY